MTQQRTLNITQPDANHIMRLFRHLSESGWTPVRFPERAKVLRNRQLFELGTRHATIRLRISVYKVGDRSESHRLDERRIEITTTFAAGLLQLDKWADIVLGYDFETDSYVGLDPRRLSLGGRTHNASSFVDPAALHKATQSRILIRPHENPSLGLEYQAVFRPKRLSEYLHNYKRIHNGLYLGDGMFSASVGRRKHVGSWTLPTNECEGKQLVLEHLTVKCIVSTASKVGAAFVCVYGTERLTDGLDQPFDRSRGNAA